MFTAVTRAAGAYQLPVVLSTVWVKLGANSGTTAELRDALPPTEEIDRTTLKSWESPDFRFAVEATGRAKIIMTRLWLEVCVAFPTVDMLREGYEIYPVADAIGGISASAHDSAMQRMLYAGAQPVTAISLVAELQRDWGRANADSLRSILRWYFPRAAGHLHPGMIRTMPRQRGRVRTFRTRPKNADGQEAGGRVRWFRRGTMEAAASAVSRASSGRT